MLHSPKRNITGSGRKQRLRKLFLLKKISRKYETMGKIYYTTRNNIIMEVPLCVW
jgi:hypothetical protein